MYVHPLSNVHDEFHVGIVVVVRASRDLRGISSAKSQAYVFEGYCIALQVLQNVTYLDILICHSDIVGIGFQIFRRSHDRKLNCSLVPKCLVSPFSYRSNFLDRCNSVVGNQDLFRGISRWCSNLAECLQTDRSDDCMAVIAGNKVLYRPCVRSC